MFLLLDRVEHECRNCFTGQSETHLGSSAFPAKARIFQRDSFGGTNKRGYLMTSCQSLLNNFPPGPASRSNNE